MTGLLSFPLFRSFAGRKHELAAYLKEHCVVTSETEAIISPSGRSLGWLIDTRAALLRPVSGALIASLMWDKIKPLLPVQLCCLEMTGIPLMVAIQHYALRAGYPLNGLIVRRTRKPYGRRRLIEGTPTAAPICLVDDVFNSGASIETMRLALAQSALAPKYLVALVDFGRDREAVKPASRELEYHCVLRLDDLGLAFAGKPQKSGRSLFSVAWRYSGLTQCESIDMVPGADPVLGNSQVYFCGDRRCVALDGGNGEIVWEQTDKVCHEKGIRSTPLVYGGNIYVGTYDGDLLAMSAETGIQLWRFDEAEWIGSSPDVYEAGHSIIIGLEHAHDTIKGSVIAIDISTGLRKWEVYVHHYVHSSPLIIDTHAKVIIGTNGGELLCIDAVSGERLWTHCCSGAIKSRASFDDKNNVIVCGSFNDQIIALDMCTGERLWTVKTAGIVYSEPCIVRDCVYVACADKFLYIIRLHTGEVVDKVFIGYRMLASPILVDEHIYVVATNGRVVQVSTTTGKITGQHNLSEQATSSLTYSPRHQLFYVATAPGALTALRLCSDLDV